VEHNANVLLVGYNQVARISLVKPEKARQVEDMIIGAAQSGQLGGKVNEANLISLLDQISEKQQHTKITVRACL
jgi:programmed cell death protein 5